MWLWVVSRLPNRVLVGAPGGGQGVLVSLLAWGATRAFQGLGAR